MNVTQVNNASVQARPDAAAVAQKSKADQAQQDQEKKAQATAAAQEAKKTTEEKQGSMLKGGEINITA